MNLFGQIRISVWCLICRESPLLNHQHSYSIHTLDSTDGSSVNSCCVVSDNTISISDNSSGNNNNSCVAGGNSSSRNVNISKER